MSRKLAPYRGAGWWRSLRQLLDTFLPFAALWFAMYLSLDYSYWVTLVLAVPTALLMVRLFIIQHDCGHGSFFRSKKACSVLGSAIGVMTLTPYAYWRQEHAVHHASSGHLDRRGHGDISTLTVAEYAALSWIKKLGYRVYRSPLVLFLVGPAFHFIVKHRLPFGALPRSKSGWASVMLTNAALAGVVLLMHFTIGLERFLLIQMPVTLLSCSVGVWLFYVQHQYESTYWRRQPEWDFHDAALYGSSHYDLGPVLQWFTGNIGLHHIHHLSSRIPNYRLQRCLNEVPELRATTRLTFLSSLRCAGLTLWDESQRKLIGFREYRRQRLSGALPARAET